MARQPRIVAPSFPHHIVQRGHNRQTIFRSPADYAMYYQLLIEKTEEEGLDIKCYCLMPNHIHFLAVPSETKSLWQAMKRINISYAQYMNKRYGMTGKLWEGRYYSSVVDKESYLWAVMRYIERNPVRARMVGKPTDYIWSSAKFSMGIEESDLISTPYWKSEHERKEYKNFLQKEDNIHQLTTIRLQTRRGRLIGGHEFERIVSKHTGRDLSVRPVGRPKQ